MIFDYERQAPVVTDDPERAANLLRKGWTLRPEPPAYDPQTQSCAWDGSQWVVIPLPHPPVPESVPAHHIRRALSAAGLRAQVEGAIAALPDGHEMRDDWEYAPTIRRDSRGVETLRSALGLTPAQVDDVFRAAGGMVT